MCIYFLIQTQSFDVNILSVSVCACAHASMLVFQVCLFAHACVHTHIHLEVRG